MVCWTLGEVRDGLEDTRGRPGRVGGPLRCSGTGRGTIGEVLDGSGNPRKVREGSEDPRGRPGRNRGYLGRYGTCQGIIQEVQ